jgi:hypothetical protein
MKKRIIYHLQKVRQQSEKTRRHILHTLVVVAGIILVLLWIYSLGTNLTSSDTAAMMNQDLKPFSALKDNMIGGYNSLSGQ